jgi:hypothetical protein
MFSHVFAIKGSPKTADGKWVEEEDWLREHHEEYDALYQQMDMEEEQVEHEYQEQQRKKIQELPAERCTGKKVPGQSVRTLTSTKLVTTSPRLKTLLRRTDKFVYW